MAVDPRESGKAIGIPVDAFGGATIDPTKNVLDLVQAANKRQDDLRNLGIERLTADLASLKDHIQALMVERDKRYEQRHVDQQRLIETVLLAEKEAVSKAEAATEKRFAGVNEFRAQLGDQQRTLMPRAEAENRLNVLSDKIGVLEGFRTEVLSKGSGTREGYGYAIGVVGLVLVLMSIISVGIVVFSRIGP